MTDEKPKQSGWEVADKVAHGAGKTLNGIALVLAKLWGLALVVIGITVFVLIPDTGWWIALLLIAYGIYLLLPGSKWVVW
jgi:hypothetical protein